jgi:uncharacterized protein YgiM (DUF1202 family)
MRRRVAFIVLAFACAAPPPPAPAPEPPPAATSEAPAGEVAIGTVRVTASALNVRAEPSTTAASIGQVRKGDRLTLIAAGDEWMKVRMDDGAIGWVAKQHVSRDGAPSAAAVAARPRRTPAGCQPDRNYSFASAPTPSFSENGAHGVVTVEATVDKNGVVQSTKVISNTTGDESLSIIAEREIAKARFVPPIRNCAQKAFIFTYKRSF